MNYVDHTFRAGDVVVIDGNRFVRCTFEADCVLTYKGGEFSIETTCRFANAGCVLQLSASAGNVVTLFRLLMSLPGTRPAVLAAIDPTYSDPRVAVAETTSDPKGTTGAGNKTN